MNITAEHEEDNRRCITGFKSKAKLFLFSFVWDLFTMQMQLRGLLQLVKCQNVFSEPQTYRYHLHLQSGLCEQKCKYKTAQHT